MEKQAEDALGTRRNNNILITHVTHLQDKADV